MTHRLVAPIAVGAASCATLAATYIFTPASELFLACPLYETTGILCPICGTTRALHALTHGDMLLALQSNAVLILALPVLLYFWVGWFRGKLPVFNFGKTTKMVVGAVFMFAVARNIDTPLFDAIRPIPI